jgi:small redox-active disulfide protein 2
MIIKILGSGCANCKKVERIARKVVETMGIEATFEKITEYPEMMKYRILSTPGLVIDEELVCAGRIPSETEVTTWLTNAELKAA